MEELAALINRAHEAVDFEDDDPFGGYAYLRGRGVTDSQIRDFKIGLGPRHALLSNDTEDGRRFNRQYDGDMSGNIVIPIYNTNGTLRGLETRRWEERKYSQYYLKGWDEDAVFLGLPNALPSIWETGTVFMVEGAFDFFPVQRVFPNTLCPLTARTTATQNRFLRRYVRNLVLLFDRDKKGLSYQERAVNQNNIVGSDFGFLVHRLSYPAKDPGALYEAWGPAKFRDYLQRKAASMNLYL